MKDSARVVSPLERALYLKSLETLEILPASELAVIAYKAKEHFFRKGEALFRPEEPVGGFHILVEGEVLVEGAEHGEDRLGPASTVGLLSLLAGWKEGMSAVAATDTLTLEIEADDFYDVLEDHFSILHHEIRILACRMLEERKRIPEGTYLAPAEGLFDPPDGQLDLIERLLYFRRGTAFNGANLDAMIELASLTREMEFPEGTELWIPGQPSGFLYTLLNGTVRCRVENEGNTFRAGPGYPLGNIESLCGAPRWYRAVTETPVSVLRADSGAFIDILEDHFEMAVGFLGSMASGIITVLQQQRKEKARADELIEESP